MYIFCNLWFMKIQLIINICGEYMTETPCILSVHAFIPPHIKLSQKPICGHTEFKNAELVNVVYRYIQFNGHKISLQRDRIHYIAHDIVNGVGVG